MFNNKESWKAIEKVRPYWYYDGFNLRYVDKKSIISVTKGSLLWYTKAELLERSKIDISFLVSFLELSSTKNADSFGFKCVSLYNDRFEKIHNNLKLNYYIPALRDEIMTYFGPDRAEEILGRADLLRDRR